MGATSGERVGEIDRDQSPPVNGAHALGWRLAVSAERRRSLPHPVSQGCWKRLKRQSQQVSLNFPEEIMGVGQSVVSFQQ